MVIESTTKSVTGTELPSLQYQKDRGNLVSQLMQTLRLRMGNYQLPSCAPRGSHELAAVASITSFQRWSEESSVRPTLNPKPYTPKTVNNTNSSTLGKDRRGCGTWKTTWGSLYRLRQWCGM
ncbi:hypothetical protein SLA2020_318680 [Shorea laevis]